MTTERTRTYTWTDPTESAGAAATMSGLEFLRAISAGELPRPPIAETIGFAGLEVDEGRVVFHATPAEYHYNPIGTVHGGFAATLLDSALGCAVHTMLPAGVGYTTVELKVNLVRPITATTGPVSCEANVIHVGSRVATAEGRLVDARGKLYAHGTTTCLVLRREDGIR
jgi:uncharacterized protein (TIGR00369 family)